MEKEAKKLYKKTKEMFRDAKKTFYCKTLREVIKEFRSCKTTAEERALVKKESAQIRDLFKEGDTAFRRRNVAKLLFFHMQGCPTEFGQLECLKLCISPKFKDKRVGYLGLMVLLDENQEILTLVTNCLFQDLQSNTPLIAGLALTAVGNIASAELIKDLFPLIEKHLQGKDPYLRKKALLAAVRICRKVPEYSDVLCNYMIETLSVHVEEVVLTGLTLGLELANVSPDYVTRLRSKVVPVCTNLLQELMSPTFDPELTISGITDPFLQVKILQVLRAYVKGDKESANMVGDVLIKVLSNTDSSSTSGLAVIYECVKTVIAIRELPESLRSLAVETLGGRLLKEAKDNNARYVALGTLVSVVDEKREDVKRYLDTILQCLEDPDISIRRRAVALVYALTDSSNVMQLAQRLLQFLENCENELKPDIARKLSDMADRFAPSIEWHVDCIAHTLNLTDVLMPESLISLFIALISAKQSVQPYAAKILYSLGLHPYAQFARQNSDKFDKTPYQSKPALEMVAIWVIGEYGSPLIEQGTISAEELVNCLEVILRLSMRNDNFSEENKKEILLGGSVHSTASLLREVTLTCLAKLYFRVTLSDEVKNLVILNLETYRTNLDLEVQQRACEYFGITEDKWSSFSEKLMASLPPIDYAAVREKHLKGSDTAPGANRRQELAENSGQEDNKRDSIEVDKFMDWDKLNLGKGSVEKSSSTPTADLTSLLEDTFQSSSTQKNKQPQVKRHINCGQDVKADVLFFKESLQIIKAEFHFQSHQNLSLKNFRLQVAVPKYMKVELYPANGTELRPDKEIIQRAKLENLVSHEKPWQLKYRINYEKESEETPSTFEGILRDFSCVE
eukprot:jgi/Galph1/5942/GphlegSOOS_G4548.1